MGQRIAIIGSGISGLGAAWALSRDHDITVFEADRRVGGHANTVDVQTPNGSVAVDTGFIVYNEATYPNLTRLFAALDVPTENSDMSFAYSLDRSFEYAGSVRGILAQPSNLTRRRFRATLRDINRFRRIGAGLIPRDMETVGEFFSRHGFSDGFLHDYLLPMTGAIWSANSRDIADFPASVMVRFLANHGLIDIVGRPTWRTVSGGSRTYVARLTRPFADRIRLESPVTAVTRTGAQVQVTSRAGIESFDHVVLATHSDQALRILGSDATDSERLLLGALPYAPNRAVLHSDPTLMPRRRSTWSSWNAMASSDDPGDQAVSVTYWMNRLQGIDPAVPLFVTLNPRRVPDPALVHARFTYAHPQFDGRARAAQLGLAQIQGLANTWFAGAYLGYGFHEDGLQAGLNVAAALGSPAPWAGTFAPVSSAPPATPVRERL